MKLAAIAITAISVNGLSLDKVGDNERIPEHTLA